MNSKIMCFISVLSILALSGCNEVYKISTAIKVTGNAFLITAPLTRSSSATIQILCGPGATHYIDSNTTPAISDSSWVTCSSSNFTISKSLTGGSNSFNFWFKSKTNEVTSNGIPIYAKSGNSFRLVSPTPAANNLFGVTSFRLSSTRLLVGEPGNSTGAATAGAVHIYDQYGNFINSVYGEAACDAIGDDGWLGCSSYGQSVIVLSSNRFIIRNPEYHSQGGAVTEGGKLLLYNQDGLLLSRWEGVFDYDGVGTKIVGLPGGNFIGTSAHSLSAGDYRGVVKLFNGTTGAVIATYAGDNNNDNLGSNIISLTNGNFVIGSPNDDVSGISNAGSVMLVNGTTGVIIATLTGDNANYLLSYRMPTELTNGNLVVVSPYNTVGGVVYPGSVKIINSTTGAVIATIDGDDAYDNLGGSGITNIGSGNFVVRSHLDDISGVVNAGSVKLVNSVSGAVISTISGNNTNDFFGENVPIVLSNGNFVIPVPTDDIPGFVDVGSVTLVNGSTGAVINTISGNDDNDGSTMGVVKLSNGNFVIKAPLDDVSGISNAGSVKLVNGVTGAVIATLAGDAVNDGFGGNVVALNNGNFAIGATGKDVLGVSNAGTVYLVNGASGAVIASFAGDNENDYFGIGFSVLENSNLILRNYKDQVLGNPIAGSVQLISGSTGIVMASFYGADAGDELGYSLNLLSNSNFIVGSMYGLGTKYVNGTTGAEIFNVVECSDKYTYGVMYVEEEVSSSLRIFCPNDNGYAGFVDILPLN